MISLLVVGAFVGSAAASTSLRFAGRTAQSGTGYRITFTVAGGQLHHQRFTWRARCASHQSISLGTAQGNTVIRIRHGRWHSTGRYTGKLPYAGNLTGHFQVLQNSGQLVGTHHAHGAFRLRVLIYQAGHQIDHCDTGSIHWSATSVG